MNIKITKDSGYNYLTISYINKYDCAIAMNDNELNQLKSLFNKKITNLYIDSMRERNTEIYLFWHERTIMLGMSICGNKINIIFNEYEISCINIIVFGQ